MHHPELPVFAFLSAFLVIIPLPWHWRARNVAVLALMFWLCTVNLIYGINAIVWAGNVRDPVPVWCDITTKIVVGVSYALPLCTMCICKHLEMVSSSRKVSYDAQDRQKRMIFEGIMCVLVPIIFMALHYIVQGHRYDIFEDVGCQAAVYISIPAIFIIWFPQLLFSTITLIFGALALHNFVRRRLTFALHLQQSNSAMTTNHYLRLIAMALTEMIWGTSLTTYNLFSNVTSGLRPWTNWADVHSNFSRVAAFPTLEMPPDYIRIMLFLWWTLPTSSLIFFAFFGFGQEAMKEYKKIWRWLMVKVFKRPSDGEKGSSLFGGPSLRSGRLPRTLHLVNLKSTISSSSRDYKSTQSPTSASHQSHTSQSTITLALHTPIVDPSYLNKPITRFPQSKDEEAAVYTHSPSQDPAPAYNTPYPCSYPEVYLTSEHPATDDADTFTISTFSYYGGLPSPSSPSQRFELTEPSSTPEPHGLSPPPVCPIVKRPIPKDVPSSADSVMMEEAPSSPSSPVLVPTMPQDVVESLPGMRTGMRTMNIPGGILVTVQKQASIDKMV